MLFRSVSQQAEVRLAGHLAQLDREIARNLPAVPWMQGAQFSVLDPYVFTLCRWTRNFTTTQPARNHEHLGLYLQRMLARPSVQRVLVAEQLAEPFV